MIQDIIVEYDELTKPELLFLPAKINQGKPVGLIELSA